MTALRAEGCGIAAFGGDEYIVSVTGLAFVSPVLHDKEPAEDRDVDFDKGFRGFKRFTGFRGCDIAMRAMSIKPALRASLPALIPISIPAPTAPSGAPDPRSRWRSRRRPLREYREAPPRLLVFTDIDFTYYAYRDPSLCGDPAEGLQVSRSWPLACP